MTRLPVGKRIDLSPSICSLYDNSNTSFIRVTAVMEIPPDPIYAEAIDKALRATNGQPFHIDAIARVMGGDVEVDRIRNGYALRALVRRGYLAAVPNQVDQALDFPIYYVGWTARGRQARTHSAAVEAGH